MNRFLTAFVILFVSFVFCTTTQADTPRTGLIQALIKVESSGRDDAVGDKHLRDRAYGCLQIRMPVCVDINRRYGTKYRPEDCLNNRALSIWICERYIHMYAHEKALGRKPNDEDKARIWNGGPKGWKKPQTNVYWTKVSKALGC